MSDMAEKVNSDAKTEEIDTAEFIVEQNIV